MDAPGGAPSSATAASTPGNEHDSLESPGFSPVLPPGYIEDVTFSFLPNARNIRGKRPVPIVYSSEDELEIPPEPNPITSAKWRTVKPLSVRYVDDGCTLDKINFETATDMGTGRVKHAPM